MLPDSPPIQAEESTGKEHQWTKIKNKKRQKQKTKQKPNTRFEYIFWSLEQYTQRQYNSTSSTF